MPFRDTYIMSPINRRRCSRVSLVECLQLTWSTCELLVLEFKPRMSFSHTRSVLYPKNTCFHSFKHYLSHPTLSSLKSVESCIRMGNLTCMPSSNSRAKSRLRTIVSSIVYTQAVAPISTPTFKVPSPAQMSSPIWIRTETPSNGANFRSMDDLLEAVNNQRMMLTPKRLTAAVSPKRLM
uniref:AC4 protein n=1 Tax=Begomovirus manihotis TaxID=10817 RepID=A0A385GL47_9GEMI|nr:AC4 protein [African cassava mosaic virus]